jgi:hypothetical protein
VLHSCRYGFFISHLWRTLVAFNLKFTFKPVDKIFQDASSPIPLITSDHCQHPSLTPKVGSSSASFVKAIVSLSISAWVLGSTATLITGSGKSLTLATKDASHHKGITCMNVFESYSCSNITSYYTVDWVLLIGMHLQDPEIRSFERVEAFQM